MPAAAFLVLRLMLATLVLFPASLKPRTATGTSQGRREALVAGFAQTAFQGCLVGGLAWTTAGRGAILLATSPLLAAAWEAVTGRARVSRRRWSGLLLGVLGAGLVARGGTDLAWTEVGGNLLALGAAGAWAWYSFAIRPVVARVGSLRATAWTMLIALVLLGPVGAVQLAHLPWTTISLSAWVGVAYGATAGMVVAMTLWGRSAHRLGPVDTMVYVYLEPVSAVLLAAILLGESLTPGQGAGALLALIGVWLAS